MTGGHAPFVVRQDWDHTHAHTSVVYQSASVYHFLERELIFIIIIILFCCLNYCEFSTFLH